MRAALRRLGIAALVPVLWDSRPIVSVGTYGAESSSTCAPATDDKWAGFLAVAQATVSSPDTDVVRYRAAIQVPMTPAKDVVLVTTDSLCAKAGGLMNRTRGLPDTTSHRVRMIRVGSIYWAEDDYLVGEWLQSLVIDSTLTRVLSKPGR